MADAPPPEAPRPKGIKRGVSQAGDIVGHVSNGLKVLTANHRNPASEIVGVVADALKHSAGEAPNRLDLPTNHGKKR